MKLEATNFSIYYICLFSIKLPQKPASQISTPLETLNPSISEQARKTKLATRIWNYVKYRPPQENANSIKNVPLIKNHQFLSNFDETWSK